MLCTCVTLLLTAYEWAASLLMRAKTCDTTLVVKPSAAIRVCVLPVMLDTQEKTDLTTKLYLKINLDRLWAFKINLNYTKNTKDKESI